MIETSAVLRGGLRLLALAAVAALWLLPGEARAQIGSERYASIVVDAGTGQVLSASSADEPRYPASLTKMMTLYMLFTVLESGDVSPSTRIPVSRHAASRPPSKLWLKPGSTITVRDAILALVTKSANDAASAVGEFLGEGSEAHFARLMTLRARQMGMTSTVFRNASGLPDPRQVTTARDMAILAQRLIRDFPNRYAYFSTPEFRWRGQTIASHNYVNENYDGADGLKTGFINASGFNIVTSARRDGRRLIAVVFGGATGRERDSHVMALLDRGFDLPGTPPGRGDTLLAGRSVSRGGVLAGLVPSANAAPAMGAAEPLLRRATTSARPTVAPALPRPAPRASAGKGDWAVQVGALPTNASALKVASHARRSATRNTGVVRVEKVRLKGQTLYRAQVAGLSETSARQACARMKRGACMVIAP
ncbi:D-alanyl-D-alanine carboxypeptidase [Roseomonas gilardii subsp. gilardii]|uniref:D-alanyl-D-alanine carboxypeptidase n=1 Tax=Roseomonas gilardii TaxID=257708 RepID=UPI001FF7EABE|nr:D-alanyl-D-alanine carboxypeptidase [Roseomonas gilardii]UPG74280.1 D-alanyl-D-alanine carboxypeptidase [Roseomonas gilardii subsp. gilardii]